MRFHRSCLAPLIGLALILTSTAVVGPVEPAGAQAGEDSICDRFLDAEITVEGEVGDPELDEISGLAASRRHPGVLWAHNDSGDEPRVFALDETGRKLAQLALDGAENVDWEDMAVGPGPDGEPHLFVGDIGQNIALREPAVVYRMAEPTDRPEGDGVLTDVDRLDLIYPDGPADAETLFVDPDTGDLVILTKALDGESRILTALADALVPGDPITMTEAGTVTFTDPGPVEGSPLPGTMLTGGDIAPDGSFIVLRTYKELLVFPRSGSIAESLGAESCARTVEDEPQGEAVAVTADGAALITISEFGLAPDPPVPVHRIDLGSPESEADDVVPGESDETGPDAETDPPTDSPSSSEDEGSEEKKASNNLVLIVVLPAIIGPMVVFIVIMIGRSRRT